MIRDVFKSISETFTLYDDVRKKIEIMSKWDAMMDFGDRIEQFLELGKTYKITIEEV